MKKISLRIASVLILFLLSVLNVQSQPARIRCSTTEHMDDLLQKDPNLEFRMLQGEKRIREWIKSHPDWRLKETGGATIPVVVHVVYNSAAQNISDTQIFSQIDALNEDFSRTNSDTTNTPIPFKPVASATPYQFCLAQQDPIGAPTNGIERRQTTVSSFSSNDDIKHYATGGLDAWDPTRYFNIWVGYLGPFLLGYAEFPTSTPSSTYGVVITYDAFGRVGTVSSPFDLGRTTSHEIGHCMDLYHIWGDDGGACSGSDSCNDTPDQADATSGCAVFPFTDGCTPGGSGIMFMNYMDYSDDACLNMFTEDQVSRMVASIQTFYPGLLTSNGCTPPTLFANDAGINYIQSPNAASCDTVIIPMVVLKNWGSATLTSATIQYQVDGGVINSYSWSGNLASLDTIVVTLPALTVTGGVHQFTAYTTLPNGNPDQNPLNDSLSVSFVANVGTGIPLPLTQGFEAAFPPAGYSIDNPDNLTTWNQTLSPSHSGSSCVFMDNYNYNAAGASDDLILPACNLSGTSNPELSFWLAYAHYYGALGILTDSLEVSVSTNCGATWTTLFFDGGATLNTTPSGAPVNGVFFPAPTDWERFSIDLSVLSSSTSAIFRFRNINGYGNEMFLDDINLDVAVGTGIHSVPVELKVYPNPAENTLNVEAGNLPGKKAVLKLYNASGEILYSRWVPLTTKKHTMDVSGFPPGNYFLEVVTDAAILIRPVILQR